MSNGLVVITTIRQGLKQDKVQKVRAEVSLDTAAACADLKIPIVAVFKDCSESYLGRLKKRGVILVKQTTIGMGPVRREAIKAGTILVPEAEYYLWTEPEKPTFPGIANRLLAKLEKTNAECCFFNRKNMDSYPLEQAYYYLYCRLVASQLIGFDFDYAFGPMLMTKAGAKVFLGYGGEYGDKWDSILIPRLRVIRTGVPYGIQTVSFENDPRMTAIESGNSKMVLKRIEQFVNVVPSLIAEWQKLT